MPQNTGHLGGFRPLPAGLVIDWSRFLDLDPAAHHSRPAASTPGSPPP